MNAVKALWNKAVLWAIAPALEIHEQRRLAERKRKAEALCAEAMKSRDTVMAGAGGSPPAFPVSVLEPLREQRAAQRQARANDLVAPFSRSQECLKEPA